MNGRLEPAGPGFIHYCGHCSLDPIIHNAGAGIGSACQLTSVSASGGGGDPFKKNIGRGAPMLHKSVIEFGRSLNLSILQYPHFIKVAGMAEVISLPNRSDDQFRICLDAVDTLETAFRRIRAVIELCSDGPTRIRLSKEQHLLEAALAEAKTKIEEIVANHLLETV